MKAVAKVYVLNRKYIHVQNSDKCLKVVRILSNTGS